MICSSCLDVVCTSRGRRRDRDGDKADGGEGARALAQLLTLMDGFHGKDGSSHVVVVGATNRWETDIPSTLL